MLTAAVDSLFPDSSATTRHRHHMTIAEFPSAPDESCSKLPSFLRGCLGFKIRPKRVDWPRSCSQPNTDLTVLRHGPHTVLSAVHAAS